MIDIQAETVLSFAEATDHLPRRRGRRKPHVTTLYRWAQRGCRGVKLETIQVGGTKCTSLEALQRFFDRLAGTSDEPAGADITPHRSRAASQTLDDNGF